MKSLYANNLFDDCIVSDMWSNAVKSIRPDDPDGYIHMIQREQNLIAGQLHILRMKECTPDGIVQLRRAEKYMDLLKQKEVEYYK